MLIVNSSELKARSLTDAKKVRLKLKARLSSNTILWGIPLVLVSLALWEILPRIGAISPIFFPPFSKVFLDLQGLFASGVILKHIGVSLYRAFVGFFLAIIVAEPLGFLMGRYRKFERITDLLVQALRNTSQFALLPIFIIALGIGEASKIAMTFYASVWYLLINTISGVKNVDPLLVKAAISMGTSEKDIFKKVIFPASFPSVVAGARLGFRSSLMAVIAAEMLAAKSGLGFFVQNAQLRFHFTDMYAGIIVLCILGLLFNYFLVWLEHKVTSWKVQTENINQ